MRIYLDRDLAETIPDGTFGGSRPARAERGTVIRRWTREEQTAHFDALADALGSPRRDGSLATGEGAL